MRDVPGNWFSAAPLIGVTGPDGCWVPGWWFARRALRRAGARAERLTPVRPHPSRPLDGVVIGGGEDIASHLYEELTPGATPREDPVRDAFELRILETEIRRGIPILGICRGAQLLNVAHGGSLHRDLAGLRQRTSNRPSLLPRKAVTVAPDSRLQALLGSGRIKVNSLHHQAVDRLGHGLRVAARDDDAIVQAIETGGNAFMIGVQWHPEYLPWRREQQRLFRGLVQATTGFTQTA